MFCRRIELHGLEYGICLSFTADGMNNATGSGTRHMAPGSSTVSTLSSLFLIASLNRMIASTGSASVTDDILFSSNDSENTVRTVVTARIAGLESSCAIRSAPMAR